MNTGNATLALDTSAVPEGFTLEGRIVPKPADYDGGVEISISGASLDIKVKAPNAADALTLVERALQQSREGRR